MRHYTENTFSSHALVSFRIMVNNNTHVDAQSTPRRYPHHYTSTLNCLYKTRWIHAFTSVTPSPIILAKNKTYQVTQHVLCEF